MKKEMAKRSLYIMAIVFMIGIITIFSSPAIGEIFGSKAMQRNGGSMDTRQYERVIDSNTFNFQTIGTVLSLVGGFGILLSGFAIYKEL